MSDGADEEPAEVSIDTEQNAVEDSGDSNPLSGAADRHQQDVEQLRDMLDHDGSDTQLAEKIYDRESEKQERLYDGMKGVLLKENIDAFTTDVLDDVDISDPDEVRRAMALIEQYRRNVESTFDEDVGSLFDDADIDDVDRFLGDDADGDYDTLVAAVEHQYGDDVADVVDQYVEKTLAANQKAGRSYLESEMELAVAEGDQDYLGRLENAITEARQYFNAGQTEPARLSEGLRQVSASYDLGTE
ncbi:MAG: hypothetical protein SV186_01350 [Candidatus Nanohaloarchaea archaeon]|nr:hypothetical protein [Candidatus Nanohaloarchaea archaeon]